MPGRWLKGWDSVPATAWPSDALLRPKGVGNNSQRPCCSANGAESRRIQTDSLEHFSFLSQVPISLSGSGDCNLFPLKSCRSPLHKASSCLPAELEASEGHRRGHAWESLGRENLKVIIRHGNESAGAHTRLSHNQTDAEVFSTLRAALQPGELKMEHGEDSSRVEREWVWDVATGRGGRRGVGLLPAELTSPGP